MASNVTLNGNVYSIPAVGDDNWGPGLSNYLIAIASSVLQKTGGTFTLTAEIDFGATYGIKTAYVSSKGANPASGGTLRLANTESIRWRNAANNADLSLSIDPSNTLLFNSTPLLSGLISNANIDPAAAISYSKLDLASSILDADIAPLAAITYSKLNLAGAILNADVSASAAIAYSKLNLAGSIVNADIASGAAIPYSKLSVADSDLTIAKTSGLQTALDAKIDKSIATTKGDLLVATAASTITNLGVGSNNQVLTADSAQASGVKWATPASNPVTTKGDLAGYDSSAARVPVGTNNQILMADSTQTLGLKWTGFVAPTIQKITGGSGTYTLPTSPRSPIYIRVRMCGGGGGGGGSGSAAPGVGGSGNNSTFGSSLLQALGGGGGQSASGGAGAGGTASLGTGPIGTNLSGGSGSGITYSSSSTFDAIGGHGGSNAFGGAGGGGSFNANGLSGAANTGGGGGGAGGFFSTGAYTGGGGGAGGFIDALIIAPSSTYAYSIGAGGSGGTAGTSGTGGGAGGSGYIEVTEYYQ